MKSAMKRKQELIKMLSVLGKTVAILKCLHPHYHYFFINVSIKVEISDGELRLTVQPGGHWADRQL